MNQARLLAILGVLVFTVVTVLFTFYRVDERERVIVVRFGQILRSDEPPGLHRKVPFVDDARHFDARVLTFDVGAQSIPTKEKKYLLVSAFVKWRVLDVRQYFLAVDGLESKARARVEQFVNAGVRDEFSKRTVPSLIAAERAKIMQALTERADREARKFGVEVLDVRLQRVDFTDDAVQLAFQRMKSERARNANDLRGQGEETADRIRAGAERQREVLLADVYRQAERIRGEGDARSTAIYAEAYSRAPEFFALYRSLNAYKESFKKKDDILVVDPSSDFFKYMKKPTR